MSERIHPSRSLLSTLTVGALLGTVLLSGESAGAHSPESAPATEQTSHSVAITQTNSENQTYRNTHTTLTQTSSFTVTNTGQVNGSASVAISGSESDLTAKLPLRVWPVPSAHACTAATAIPSNAASGTWGAATVAADADLAAGASIVYCVRTTLDHERRHGIAVQGGSQSAESVLSATLSAPGMAPHTATAVTTHRTEAIHPLASSYLPANKSHWYTIRNGRNSDICLDASGSRHDDAPLISWECGDGANQRWQLRPVNAGNQSLVTLQPRHAPPNLRAAVRDGEQLLEDNDHKAHTAWYVQKASHNRFMLVSQLDGTCLSVRSSSSDAAHATVECTDPDAVLDLRREGLSFQSDRWAEWFDAQKEKGIMPTGTLFFGAKIGQKLRMQYQQYGSSTWTDIATTDPESDRIKIGGPKINHQTKVRFVFSDGNIAYDGLSTQIDIENDPTPSENNYRYKLSIWYGLG